MRIGAHRAAESDPASVSLRRRTVRLVLASACLATFAGSLAAPPPVVSGDTRAGLAAALARKGLRVAASDVVFVSPRPDFIEGLSTRLALVLGRESSAARDVYVIECRLAPSGRVLGVGEVTNLTRSAGAEETSLVASPPFGAFATRAPNGIVAVTMLDTRGEEARLTRGWSLGWKLANSVTNYQETGLWRGMRRRRYDLLQPAAAAALRFTGSGRLVARLGPGRSLEIDSARDVPTQGAALASLREEVKAQPGFIGWAVDSARAISWVGPRPIEWLEHKAFGFLDAGRQAYYSVAPAQSAEDLAHELGVDENAGEVLRSAPDPDLGWPPPNLRPILRDTVEGEGVWVAVTGPFVAQSPGAQATFYTTFLRPDADRGYTRVFLTIWDPRVVEWNIRAGTTEPEDATGVAGDGQVPRDRGTLLRLVGGFNGGFQALHGEYGMGENGRVLIPPKPWAATVARLSGGRIGFGTWRGGHPGGDPEIPGEIESYRQNMTVLVQDGVVDPYRRPWWGTAPEGSADPAYTVRTGICLTQENFVAYFWGLSLSHLALAEAMRATRCSYGIHLDMNAGHSGFEYYRVSRAGEQSPLDRELERNQEAEGDVPGVPGLFFRARRMVRGMGHMNFPRYVRRDRRDFMYLLLKPILPGENLPAQGPPLRGEGEWIVKGLPHMGFPYAFARTFVRPDRSSPSSIVKIAKVDPRRVRLEPATEGDAPLGALVPASPPDTGDPLALTLTTDAFAVGPQRGGSRALATGVALGEAPADCKAAIGVDPNGILVWVQGAAPSVLARALDLASAGPGMGLCGNDPHFDYYFGQSRVGRLDELAASTAPSHAVRLFGHDEPAAVRIFPDTPVVPPMVWFPEQKVRIRYFHELQPINPAGIPRPLTTNSQ